LDEGGAVLLQLVVALALMVATTVIHGLFMVGAMAVLGKTHAKRWGMRSRWTRISLVAGLVQMMFLASVAEVALWAAVYVAVGALSAAEPALYFSMVTFTTLGYGDVLLHPSWRLLASFQAATGIIMFGWTTGIIFAFVHRVSQQDVQELEEGGL
jgi:hypothetical protein